MLGLVHLGDDNKINGQGWNANTPTARFPYGAQYLQSFQIHNDGNHGQNWHMQEQHFQVCRARKCFLRG